MGIRWPRSNSFEFDANGDPAGGAKLYIYDADTTTPKSAYTTAALSATRTQPITADGNGRWPAVYLDFGAYKEVATTSGGTTLWTDDDIPNDAPTDPAEGVDADSIFQTGDILIVGKNGTRSGFVRCNGRTIGSAASAATERANADCADLFAFIWNNYANGQAAVSTGRGGSAAADFAANKTIAMPDGRAVGLVGFDDMGNTAASLLGSAPVVSGSGILAGSIIGANTHTLSTAELSAHTHAGTTASDGAHTHTATTDSGGAHTHSVSIGSGQGSHTHTVGGGQSIKTFVGSLGTSGTSVGSTETIQGATDSATLPSMTGTAASDGAHTHTLTTASNGAHTHTFTSGSTGGAGAHNNLSRSIPVTVLMKL